jgi:biofilm PGA synthesis N-glycosyltransferase PgaC
MFEFIEEFIAFIKSLTVEHFVRLFWFFIFFEMIRYIILEFVILLTNTITNKLKTKDFIEAERLFRFDNPFLSIIVPGKNEGENLFKLINSLKEQTYTNFEIIVVDDGSDDETPTIGRKLEKLGLIKHFIRNEIRGGKASAANLALRFSKGKYVIHLDADCSFDNDAIEKIIIPFYLDDRIGAVGGNVAVRNYKESLVTTMQAIEYYDTISISRIVSSKLGIYRVISGAFGAFKKEALDSLKGWDIGPGLDGDLTVKIRKLGYKIEFAPEAMCLTNAPNTLEKLTKQRLRWDKSLVRFRMRKHKNIFYPNKSFNFSNFISLFENITYGFVLNIKWVFYVIDMWFNNASQIEFIFVTNVLLYTVANYFKFIVFSLFRTRKNAPISYFLIYIPAVVFYFGYYLRSVRLVAHFQEIFFKTSYNDPWNPKKTSRFAKDNNM